jgi:hypothetical protein
MVVVRYEREHVTGDPRVQLPSFFPAVQTMAPSQMTDIQYAVIVWVTV